MDLTIKKFVIKELERETFCDAWSNGNVKNADGHDNHLNIRNIELFACLHGRLTWALCPEFC